jgi:hypothetical protein
MGNQSARQLKNQPEGLPQATIVSQLRYEGKPCQRRRRHRDTVINIAEMLADTIDYGLMVVQLMPGTEEYEGWLHYALFMNQSSPTLREHVNENQEWYLAYWRRLVARHPRSAKVVRRVESVK